MLRHVAFGACAVVAFASSAFAHHPSGTGSTGNSGPIATLSATTLEKGQSVAGVVFEMVKLDTFSNAQLIDFAGKHVHAHGLDAILAPSLVYAYGVTKDLTVSLRLPYIERRDVREGSHSHGPAGNTVDFRGDAAGIGDLTLMAQYRFFNDVRSRIEAAVIVGLKAPTGRTGVHDAGRELFNAEFQPGSGSWDGLAGLAFTKRFGAWSFDASVLYQLATEGTQNTDLGDRFSYNLALSYRLTGAAPGPMYHGGPGQKAGHSHPHQEPPAASRGPALDLVLEFNGEWHAREETAGVREPNSGGNVVYLSPGLRLSMDAWSGFVSVGVPVINEVNGVQAEPAWRLMTGVSVNF